MAKVVRRITDLISREKLERLYVRDGLSTVQIAERIGTNRESVRKLIHHYELPIRDRGAWRKLR